MSLKELRRRSFRCSKDSKEMRSNSICSLTGDRMITKFPAPYSYACTPYQDRNFSEEVHAACREIHETSYERQRCTKVIVVGDVAVGKTCLVKRFCLQPFETNYKATIGVDFEAKKCFILNIPYILQIWDTAGQEKFKCIANSYYRGAKVVILVFDFSQLSSLYNIRKWLESTLKCNENPLLFLVGTKKDKVAKSAFKLTEQEAFKIANDIGAEYWPVSSKTGENVEALFSRVAIVSFCRDVIIETEKCEEVQVSDDFVRISKTSPKKKNKKCGGCS